MAETVNEQVNGTASDMQEQHTFTQDEVDAIVTNRLKREGAKYADYEELKAKASKLDEIEEANKSELQKATEKAEALQKQLDDLTTATKLRDIREKVSTETGVPINLLNADTEEACKAQAEAIIAFANNKPVVAYPSVKDGGEPNIKTTKDAKDQFADWFKASLSN